MSDLTAGLTGGESAALLVLAAQAEPVRNPDLKSLGGALAKQSRDRLAARGLIEVTRGARGANVIALTDRGWAAAGALLEADPPAGAPPATRALFTFGRGLGRYLRREAIALGEVLVPHTETPDTQTPDTQTPDTQTPDTQTPDTEPAGTEPAGTEPAGTVGRVRDAYLRAAPRPGAWVPLTALRSALTDLPRRDVDDALTELYLDPGVHMVAEDNQKALTAADRDAALRLGDRRLTAIRVIP